MQKKFFLWIDIKSGAISSKACVYLYGYTRYKASSYGCSTAKNYLGPESDPLPIIPGMVASVDILTGKKTILAYLLKPVLRAKYMALREQ